MNQQARALAGKVGPTISEFSGGRGSHRAGLRNKAGATGDLPGVDQDIDKLVGKIRPYLPYHEGQQNTPRSPEDRQEIALAVAKAFGFRVKGPPQAQENIEKIIEQYDRIAALLNEYKQRQDSRVNVAQKLGGGEIGDHKQRNDPQS
jgi:hypothetical protein